ncbi:MAG: type I-F CRISPR-associated protein Csy1, partial [Desulfobacteraceae bacterium]|nr:type I-F CRISPR-associated protein Csy1 [Desulfobacteraceae bacterium]
MAEKVSDYIKSKKSDPETWLPEKLGAPAKKRSRPATHIGKYTHPDADINASIQVNLIHGIKGYLVSGNFATTLTLQRNLNNLCLSKPILSAILRDKKQKGGALCYQRPGSRTVRIQSR